MAWLQVFLPTLLLQIRSSSQTTFLISATRPSPCLYLSSWFQLPAISRNYSNKPTASSREDHEASHPLDTIKPAPTAPDCLLSVIVTPLWPSLLCSLLLPQSVSVCGQSPAIYLTCRSCVFAYLHSRGWESLPHRQGEEKAINAETPSHSLKQEWLFFHCFSLTLFMSQYYLSYCGLTYNYFFIIITSFCNVDRDLSRTQLCTSSRVYHVVLQIGMILIHMTWVHFCTLSHFRSICI